MAIHKLHVYPLDSEAQVIRKNANESDDGATAFTFAAADFIKVLNTGGLKVFIEIGATSTGYTVFTTKKIDGLDVSDRVVAAATNTLSVLNDLDSDLYNEDSEAGAGRSFSDGTADDGYVAIQFTQPTGVNIWASK